MTPAIRQPEPLGLVPGPFHDRIAALNRQQGWTGWMGHASPTVLDTVEFEYFAIRNGTTLFDISPMNKYRIAGPDAEAVVNRLVTRDIRKLKPGRVAYAIWCNAEGNVVDDGTVFRLAPNEFRLCCQEPQLGWLDDVAWGYDVTITDDSAAIAALAVQGPTSCAVLKAAGLAGVEELKPFDIRSFRVETHDIMVSRTGFTGDLGYELWMAPGAALGLWDRLMEAGRVRGIRAIGYAAVEMARIEAGFLLPRVDFLSSQTHLRPGRARNPYELGLDWLVALDKPHFNGRRALLALSRQRPARRLVTIEIDRDKPAHHAFVYHRKRREVGFVTSALWSPTVKRNIACAWIEAPWVQDGGDLWVEIYRQRELTWNRRMARARIVERRVFDSARRRATPPADF
ncbi:MAG: aminomethyl transferase family protein [Defluviimonas sp.]|uniref:aminomethyltransferase family protein n=1 Tax=Albidovulum sp. TaxID=1872424 RepID=UPI001D3D4874|nr:aminomethyltransferase family protein [Paracoccaceae bacterium]MCC0064141.1 aminomethyl transferase family protein [Defluviimonas sp.]